MAICAPERELAVIGNAGNFKLGKLYRRQCAAERRLTRGDRIAALYFLALAAPSSTLYCALGRRSSHPPVAVEEFVTEAGG